MKLYIANCTHQRQEINYRLDFVEPSSGNMIIGLKKPHNKLFVQSGHQGVIDLKHASQADAIMGQLARVGGRPVGEKNRLPRSVVPYLMQLERPVPAKLIDEVNRHNVGVLGQDGDLRRQRAAVAAGNATVKKAMESNAIKSVREFDVEYEQTEGEEGTGQKRLEQGVHVDLSGNGGPTKRGGGNRRSARS